MSLSKSQISSASRIPTKEGKGMKREGEKEKKNKNKLSKATLQFDPRLHLEIRIYLTESQYRAIRIYFYS